MFWPHSTCACGARAALRCALTPRPAARAQNYKSAFNLFLREQRSAIRDANAECAGYGHAVNNAVNVHAGAAWHALPDTARRDYEERSARDKIRYWIVSAPLRRQGGGRRRRRRAHNTLRAAAGAPHVRAERGVRGAADEVRAAHARGA